MDSIPLIIKQEGHEEGGAEVWVPVSVQGQPYACLLDTGSAITTLPWDQLTSPIQADGHVRSHGLVGAIHEDRITVSDLIFGPIERATLSVARMANHQGLGRPLIGMDLLKDSCCYFFFDRHQLVITAESPAAAQPLMVDTGMQPLVPVCIEDTMVEAVWDTGASLTCVDSTFIAAHPTTFRPFGTSDGTDASGTTATTPLFWMDGLTCKGYEFPEHLVVSLDLTGVNATRTHPMTMILGYNMLSHANWVFDFPSRRWDILAMITP